MKTLKLIKKIFAYVFVTVFFAFAITMTILLLNYNKYGVTQFGDTSLIIVNGDISSDKYKKGDLVFVEEKKLRNLNVGDEIFTYRLEVDGTPSIELGTIGQIYEKDNAIAFENGDTFDMEFVIGIANSKMDGIGTYLSIIESKWGFLFIVLVPSFLIFVYQIYALIIEIKFGSEDEQE